MRTQVQINRTERGGTRRGGRAVPVRLLLALLIVVLLAGSGWLAERASAQSADQVFAPDVNGVVHAIAVQSDGKIVIGGMFTVVDGQPRTYMARLRPDGSLDRTFAPQIGVAAFNGVYALAVLPDDKILVGGSFSIVNGVVRSGLVRLNVDGSLDGAFSPTVQHIRTIAVQEDGKILIGGIFASVNGQGHKGIARLASDGTLDNAFDTQVDSGYVTSMYLQDDGQILFGGFFSSVDGHNRSNLARIDRYGDLDIAYSPVLNNTVLDVLVQPNGQSVIAGSFTVVNAMSRNRIARLNANGTLDPDYNPNANAAVAVLLQLPSGKLLVGGDFTSIGGSSQARIALLDYLGSASESITINADKSVLAAIVQSNLSILIGGDFTAIGGLPRSHIARIDSTGAVERSFVLATDSPARAIAYRPDGSLLIGGDFSMIGGASHSAIARIKPDLTVDATFTPTVAGSVFSILAFPNGEISLGGSFTAVNNEARNNLVRLDTSGKVVSSLDLSPNGPVLSLIPEADGSTLVGGEFSQIGDLSRNNLARFFSDNTIDQNFTPVVSGAVRGITLQADGKIVLGGDFIEINGQKASHVVRLHKDGSVDASLASGVNDSVQTLIVQPDGGIVIGGDFTLVNDQAQAFLARINSDGSLDMSFRPIFDAAVHTIALQPNGDILVGGVFRSVNGIPRNAIARLKSSGELDLSYDPDVNGNVHGSALLPSGDILIVGEFSEVGGQSHNNLARLSSNTVTVQSLVVSSDGYSIEWQYSGAGPDVSRSDFEFSIDAMNFSPLGTGTRTSTGWQLSQLNLPLFQNVWVRAHGEYPSGQSNGSTSSFTLERLVYVRAVDVVMNTIVSGGTAMPSKWNYVVDSKQVVGDATLRVVAGVYTVTATPPPDYTLTNVGGACALVGSAIQLTAANNGGNCELTYTRDTGTITFVKVVDGGTAQPANFSFAAGGKSAGHTQQMTLETGTYTVTESGPGGYAVRAASGACALENGAIRLTVTKAGGTCTVTNTMPVTFSKIVEGGVSVPGDWSFSVAGQPVAHGGQKLLAPGTYSVTESGPTGYTLVAAGGDCTLSDGTVWLTVPAGSPSTATCTLTNRRDQGTIAFATTVEGEGATAADFTYTVLGQNAGDGGQLTLDTDLYTVSVAKPATFVPRVASGACSLVAGAVRLEVTQAGGTCAVTFTRLVRFVNVVEGGTRSPGAWSFRVPIDGVEQIVFHNRDVLLAPGTYTVTQQGAVDYYSLADASGNCTLDKGKIIVNAPGSGICTVTNVRNTGGIWFTRIVQGDAGAKPEDWVVMVENLPVSMGVTVTLDTDTYTVYESGPTDYALTLAGGICSLYKGNIVLEVTEAGGECLLVSTPGVGPVGFVVAPSGGTALPSAWEFAVAGQRIPHNGALLMPIGVFPISLVGPADYVVTAATGICSYDGTDISLVVGTDGGTCNLALTYDPNAPDPGTDPGTDPNPSDAAFIYLPAVQR